MSRIVIFANGILPDAQSAQAMLRADDFLIGADGGSRWIAALGLTPDLIIGDLDSLPAEDARRWAKVETLRFPADKNETDLELAVRHALSRNPAQVLICAALGGRADQTLANIALLANPNWAGADLRLDDGVEEICLCRAAREISGSAGDLVSLLPWQGDAFGVTTRGLRWALNDETLFAHQTRGVSNEMTGGASEVRLRSGLLLVIHRRQDHERNSRNGNF